MVLIYQPGLHHGTESTVSTFTKGATVTGDASLLVCPVGVLSWGMASSLPCFADLSSAPGFAGVVVSHSVVSDSLRPHGL